MLAHSFLVESSSKLLVTRTGIKARTSSISDLMFPWPIYLFFCLMRGCQVRLVDDQKKCFFFFNTCLTQVSDRCPLGYLFFCKANRYKSHSVSSLSIYHKNKSQSTIMYVCISTLYSLNLPACIYVWISALYSHVCIYQCSCMYPCSI